MLKIHPEDELWKRKNGSKGLGESLMLILVMSTGWLVVRLNSPTILGASAWESFRFMPPQLMLSFMGRVLPRLKGLAGIGSGRVSSSGIRTAMGESRP